MPLLQHIHCEDGSIEIAFNPLATTSKGQRQSQRQRRFPHHAPVDRKHCTHCQGYEGPCECQSGCPIPTDSVGKCKCVPIQRGFLCHSCGTRGFQGPRYKCQVCPDFDLCQGCYERGCCHDRTHAFYVIVGVARPPSTPLESQKRGNRIPPAPLIPGKGTCHGSSSGTISTASSSSQSVSADVLGGSKSSRLTPVDAVLTSSSKNASRASPKTVSPEVALNPPSGARRRVVVPRFVSSTTDNTMTDEVVWTSKPSTTYSLTMATTAEPLEYEIPIENKIPFIARRPRLWSEPEVCTNASKAAVGQPRPRGFASSNNDDGIHNQDNYHSSPSIKLPSPPSTKADQTNFVQHLKEQLLHLEAQQQHLQDDRRLQMSDHFTQKQKQKQRHLKNQNPVPIGIPKKA